MLSFSEAITPWLNKLRGSIISAAPREYIYVAAKIDFAPAGFQGFSCCEASLRNEGCFFFDSGSPKLASGQGGAEEETKGAALASQQGFYLFLLEVEQERI